MAKKRTRLGIGKQLSGPELREFRKNVAELKRQNLIPGHIDARTARPLQVRGGQALSDYVRKYREVLSGHAAVVSLPPDSRKEQLKIPGRHRIKDGRILVPKTPEEKVIVSPAGTVKHVEPISGMTRIDLPIKYLDADPNRIKELEQELKPHFKDLYYGYSFHDNKGFGYSRSLSQLINKIKERYQARLHDGAENYIPEEEFYKYMAILAANNPNKVTKKEKLAPKRKARKRRKKK